MTELLRPMTDPELEAALRDLATALEPAAPTDLAQAVRLRLVASGAPAPVRPRLPTVTVPWFGRPVRRGLVLAVAALLVLAGIAAAIGFGLPGLRIVFFGPSPTPTAPPASGTPGASPTAPPTPSPTRTSTPIGELDLGQAVDPDEASARAGYPVVLPTIAELGPPLDVYVDDSVPAVRVSATYPARPGIPAAPGTTVAILITEFPGALDEGYLQKGIGPDTSVEPVRVGGRPGFWISGAPHELLYVRPDGSVDGDSIRLVGDVLAWTVGDLTVRIEGAPDLATALRIAESAR